jgi:hypothetical protein
LLGRPSGLRYVDVTEAYASYNLATASFALRTL